jgi:hypothetical protein
VALKNMRRTAAERKSDSPDDGPASTRVPEHDDVEVQLQHHHIEKLGLKGPLPHGTKIQFTGEGEIADSGTREGYSDAEPQHHMTLRLRRAELDQGNGADERRKDVRGDVERAADQVEQKGKK